MKKTSKNATPPTPAAQSAAPAPASAPKKTAAAASVTAKPANVSRSSASGTGAAPVNPPRSLAPAPKPAPAKPAAVATGTVIKAKVDVGFGNALYVRGEGGNLSWDKGILLSNVSADEWTISVQDVKGPILFKFLINDETWSVGEDYLAAPDATTVLSPSF